MSDSINLWKVNKGFFCVWVFLVAIMLLRIIRGEDIWDSLAGIFIGYAICFTFGRNMK